MKVPFIDLNSQHAPLRREFEHAISEVIESGAFAGGPFVEQFEEDFATYCDCQHAIGLGSGTEALWLALLACGISSGDEVITVPSTFMATAEAITCCGARPVFVDIDEATYTMDPRGLDKVITNKTKAIIPVHLFGQSADMDPIIEFAHAHDLYVIEDAAQAHGGKYKGRKVGSIGDAGCFSFYPTKNLGAFGEAGAVVTNNFELQKKIRILRDHGQIRKYHHDMIGWNCRMDAIQAVILRIKLRNLDHANQRRRAHAAQYTDALEGIDEVATPAEAGYAQHVYHIYAIRVQERDGVLRFLADNGIACGVHYPIPVHLQPAYAALGYKAGAFPVSEQLAQQIISLPMFPELNPAQLQHVAGCLAEAVTASAAA